MTVNYSDYMEQKMAFNKAHKGDFKVETSSMNEYGQYHKEYIYADGAIWYEVMLPAYEEVIVTGVSRMTGIEIVDRISMKYLKTEFWSSDNATSNCYYEKF